ncbi:MAG: hypothetical protein K5886_00620 [Lachnospiraceae bacterium]|nr:hypothetical protein [Lachnospiraceae bacterium]
MAEKNNKGIFREKSMERISSPEQLDDYIRVVPSGVWLFMAGIILLFAGVIIWAALGTIPVQNADGVTEMIHPISYLIN